MSCRFFLVLACAAIAGSAWGQAVPPSRNVKETSAEGLSELVAKPVDVALTASAQAAMVARDIPAQGTLRTARRAVNGTRCLVAVNQAARQNDLTASTAGQVADGGCLDTVSDYVPVAGALVNAGRCANDPATGACQQMLKEVMKAGLIAMRMPEPAASLYVDGTFAVGTGVMWWDKNYNEGKIDGFMDRAFTPLAVAYGDYKYGISDEEMARRTAERREALRAEHMARSASIQSAEEQRAAERLAASQAASVAQPTFDVTPLFVSPVLQRAAAVYTGTGPSKVQSGTPTRASPAASSSKREILDECTRRLGPNARVAC